MMTDVLRQGRYRLERPLGTGAMGTVVLARDTVLDRPVAIKMLAGHLAADDTFRQRFLREARLAARLCHPNIVQVFDAGDDAAPFLVMEYVDGETVADRLGRGPRFSAEEVMALAVGLSSGLAQAHGLGIVHRDVKPHNVLLARNGAAKLTDFGIARAMEDRGLTQIGTVLGTAPFMAPEQAAGQPVGPAADVFALGALVRHAAADGTLPPALQALVDAASAQDPVDRPTAAEFYDRLAAVDDAPTVVAAPAPTTIAPIGPSAEVTQREQRRWSKPSLVALATAALVILILLLALLPRGAVDDAAEGSPVTPVPEAPNAAQSARNLAGWLRGQAGGQSN